MAKPVWVEELSPKGVYFEGFVDNADPLLERYKAETVTTYGVKRSRGKNSKTLKQDCSEEDKENAGKVCVRLAT